MKDYSKDFGPFNGKVWLNSASEGALPHIAVLAAKEAIEWKIHPCELTLKRFTEVPKQLKRTIGRLLNVPAADVILGNSASYGIHLLANGIPWGKGDEILLMQNDFPTDIVPWLGLTRKGVVVRQVKPKAVVLSPEELKANISPKTKLFCISHVHTFTGHVADIRALGEICRQNNIIFAANLTQTLGTLPVDVAGLSVDAITSSGFKWLCGPYGTGFCWMTPQLRETLDYNQAFWAAVLTEDDLKTDKALKLPQVTGTHKYDVFGTANFFNFKPLTASIEYLLSIGIDKIHEQNNALIQQLIRGLKREQYDLISPHDQDVRSPLLVISHKNPQRNNEIFIKLRDQGIYGAFWKGNMRFAPHIFNTPADIDRLLSALHSL